VKNRYRVRKTYFVYADTLDEIREDVDDLEKHHILEIDLIEEENGN
jgi:hypothetical protein